jgi:MFS family permease
MPVYYNQTLGWASDTYSQVAGGPAAVLEFIGALLGGILADRFGRRKIMFLGWGGFSVWCGIFGLMIMSFDTIPYWIQFTHLIIWPVFYRNGHSSNVCLGHGSVLVQVIGNHVYILYGDL